MKTLFLLLMCSGLAFGQTATALFDGSDLSHWSLDKPKGWSIDKDGAMTCHMGETLDRKGKKRVGGLGYIWTKKAYGDFDLTLTYKLSEAANSGVFYRTDPKNAVQGGFEVQLLDDEGFQKVKGEKPPKNLNGSFYDAAGPLAKSAKPVGEWNTFRLRCVGPKIEVWINDIQTVNADVDDWDTAGKNPDGTTNKFKTALKDLPRTGKIGFQNHGQQVWFKDVVIKELAE